MLILGSRIHGTPVMSLQTGTRLATVSAPLIDPANLKIMAYEVDSPLLDEHPSFLRIADIREIGSVGMIIDSSDELIGLRDVIKIEQLHDLKFNLIGMSVIDEHKVKLGKIEDYTLEAGDFIVQQLTVKRGFLKGITHTSLLIHRSQIIEINRESIIVKGTAKKLPTPVMQATRTEFVNPFRAPQPEEV